MFFNLIAQIPEEKSTRVESPEETLKAINKKALFILQFACQQTQVILIKKI